MRFGGQTSDLEKEKHAFLIARINQIFIRSLILYIYIIYKIVSDVRNSNTFLTWKFTDLLWIPSVRNPVLICFCQAAKSAGVPVIMDAGGMDAPVPGELLSLVDIFSPNETELARLTGMPTETFEQISQAAGECHKMVRCLSWISFICFSIFLPCSTIAYSLIDFYRSTLLWINHDSAFGYYYFT